ncbi:v-type atp synthase subunit e [Cystoisospora suis]|uniref:V-type atp synthase subunit e n=1 Tax=Cystoisospora suis TaxID=483139 RepID=A0A2C6JID4_9APIC|nr:v-type atp synthase subunit e [Cystoisospora suis]
MGSDPVIITGEAVLRTSMTSMPTVPARSTGCATVPGSAHRGTTANAFLKNHRKNPFSLIVAPFVVLAAVPCLLASDVSPSSDVVALCNASRKEISIVLREGSSAELICSRVLNRLRPSALSGTYCETKDCSSEKSLTSIPGVQVTALTRLTGYSIIVNEAPADRQVLYFACSQPGGRREAQDACVVGVTIEPDQKLQRQSSPLVCAADEVFVTMAKAGESVVFSCPQGGTLLPGGDGFVYSTSDCDGQTHLDEVVPGAQITSDRSKNPPEYTLSLTELPTEAINSICLKTCTVLNPSKVCSMHFRIAAKTIPGGSDYGAGKTVPDTGKTVPGIGRTMPDAGRDGTGSIPDAGRDATRTIPDAGRDASRTIPDAGRDASRTIPDADRDAGWTIPDADRDAGWTIPEADRDAGRTISRAGKTPRGGDELLRDTERTGPDTSKTNPGSRKTIPEDPRTAPDSQESTPPKDNTNNAAVTSPVLRCVLVVLSTVFFISLSRSL